MFAPGDQDINDKRERAWTLCCISSIVVVGPFNYEHM
jgi:hypothetical protein